MLTRAGSKFDGAKKGLAVDEWCNGFNNGIGEGIGEKRLSYRRPLISYA
jgi:hypothetical protein